MKKIIAFCISFLMLFCIACNKTPDRLADGSVKFTAENYPKVCVTSYSEQIGINLAVSVLGITPLEASKFITVCATTDECYKKLINGECDIVFAHGYGKSVTEKLNTTKRHCRCRWCGISLSRKARRGRGYPCAQLCRV